MEFVSFSAAVPKAISPVQQLVSQGMQFSKDARIDKRWSSVRQAAHVLSGEFALLGWNVRGSVTHGPYLSDLRVNDFEPETLPILLLASKFNEIESGSSAWYPLVTQAHHANTANIVDMANEKILRLEMVSWLCTILCAPKTYIWTQNLTVNLRPVIRNVISYLHSDINSKKHKYLGTDAHVSSMPRISCVDGSKKWNDFLNDYRAAASSDQPETLREFLLHIPSSLTHCQKTDLISRPIDNNEDLAVLIITLVVIYDNIIAMHDITTYTGSSYCFDSGPAFSYLNWWSDYSWERFDNFHGRDVNIGLPKPIILSYMQEWKGALQITKHVAKTRARFGKAMLKHRHEIPDQIKALEIKNGDRTLIKRDTIEGRQRRADFQKRTLYDWCKSLPFVEDYLAVPLRIDRVPYDEKIMQFARRGLGNQFTTVRSVRTDIIPRILKGVKNDVMSKIHGRISVRLLCDGDAIITEPISKTLFIYQVSSSWIENEYPKCKQPLEIWVDGYRTRVIALLVFEFAITGTITREGYNELISEFEGGVDLKGLYRDGRLQRILSNVPEGRKWSEVMATVNSLNFSISMEASVTRELIDLCMKCGLSRVFKVAPDRILGGYLKIYGVIPGDGAIEFDSMVNLAGIEFINDTETPFLFGPSGKWRVSFYDVGGEVRAHLHEKIEWSGCYSHTTQIRESIFLGTNEATISEET